MHFKYGFELINNRTNANEIRQSLDLHTFFNHYSNFQYFYPHDIQCYQCDKI